MLTILFALFRSLLSLRYRIQLEDFSLFETDAPIVVFPNHPALVDPIIVTSFIGKKKILSPVMTETYFNTPGLGPIVRALHTIPVGDVTAGGSIKDVEKAFRGIETALENRKNILIYPSGHIYVQPFEHIVGKKMAFEILSRLPEGTRVITLQTRGLWGSMWGKAYTGKSPALVNVLLKSLWYILANGLFFLPKRDVTITCTDMTETLREWQKLGLDTFNENLQNHYNTEGNEPCRFIPHYSYYNDVAGKREPQMIEGSVAEAHISTGIQESDIPMEVFEKVSTLVATVKKIDKKLIYFHTNLVLDLHADSLDMAECKSVIQSNFSEASNPPITRIKTVGDLAAMAIGKLQGEDTLPPVDFARPTSATVKFSYQKGDTILSRLIGNFEKEETAPFLYDTMMGSMTREDFLLKASVIGEYIKRFRSKKSKQASKDSIPFPENTIGIMLPALSATSLLLVGVYIAGKIPVMLNWTVGEKSFAHCMNFAHLDTILTSRKFYEKVRTPWLAAFEGKMIFIEDIIRDISLFTKMKAVIRKTLSFYPRQQDEAIILFTSGSESLPKAVVLTHENILTDIDGALKLVPFREHETILGFLPPFHSFGFTINTIFPLVAPVQAAYTPDPGDARTIGALLSHTQATIISATPTFLRMILAGNDTNMLQSLAFAFIGAEKCGDDVFELCQNKCPDTKILEGYGITECSPIVTVNPLDEQRHGSAGKFLPDLEYRIRGLDGKTDMNTGEQGMILVSGSSIFRGYVDPALETPFEEIDGKSWYKTGDLGYTDLDGFLFITGRLKRFVKIAGEMISLPFIEGILLEKYGDPEKMTLAIEAKEENGNVVIIAFTIFDTIADELNDYIHAHGASNLVKIEQVVKLNEIPLLGTGKTDYKLLKSRIDDILLKHLKK